MKILPEGTAVTLIHDEAWKPIRMAEIVYLPGDESMGFAHLRDCLTGEILTIAGQGWLEENLDTENMSLTFNWAF